METKLEYCETEETAQPDVKSQAPNKTESAQAFQKFIYDLFEKNGILNDLRAHLRGHIVNVLNTAQTGEKPMCQQHFTQRLEPKFQALNMLVAEYLLCLEFSYSLSVFVSEIPLANMVFTFAKTLMAVEGNDEVNTIRFKESDVWSILNYLGLKCDSKHARGILEMYQSQKDTPLMLCILENVKMFSLDPVHTEPEEAENSSPSTASLSSCSKSPSVILNRSKPVKCRHYSTCNACQERLSRFREKCSKRMRNMTRNVTKDSNLNPLNVESFMKNIGAMEKHLIDEMFEQLKAVYESEMDMMRTEQRDRLKKSLASHSLHFQQRHNEMEESFKAREVSLENNIEHKKRFLWGLAKSLRDQHAQMSNAMKAVRQETTRLADKEQSLKSQLAQAEDYLNKRGEDMRNQISKELVILEGHLENMKQERDSINRERYHLETMKNASESHMEENAGVNNELRSHYDLLIDELKILKTYIETTKMEPRCVIDRAVVTDLSGVNSRINVVLNNGGSFVGEERPPVQVVNDLKKLKIVNFSQPQVESIDQERSRSSPSSSGGDASIACDDLQRLREENERLRAFARQQSEHITEMSSRQARLAADRRPAHAPDRACLHLRRTSTSASANAFGWRKGAGEELSLFAHAQPRILVPGDKLPFVGVLGERNLESRRHLINQWRTLRRRVSPQGTIGKRGHSPTRKHKTSPSSKMLSIVSPQSSHLLAAREHQPLNNEGVHKKSRDYTRPKTASVMESIRTREKSPKSVLREAKEKLKTTPRPCSAREKSPTAVLKEAKQRLRKLEIEADAVERSYLNFRRQQTARRDENAMRPEIDLSRSPIACEVERGPEAPEHSKGSIKRDLEQFLQNYKSKFDIARFSNKNTANEIIKPIPNAYSEMNEKKRENYLETPICEFRKLYQTCLEPELKTPSPVRQSDLSSSVSERSGTTEKSRSEITRKTKSNHQAELEILEKNLTKMYNLEDEPTKENSLVPLKDAASVGAAGNYENEKNVLRVEIESVSETNELRGSSTRQDMLLVVESSMDSRYVGSREKISTQMTIVVSPKRSPKDDEKSGGKRSLSPEQEAHLTRNDVLDAIFHADDKDVSSSVLRIEEGYDFPDSEKEAPDQYLDDFSADVDNYNSKSEADDITPISLPKTSEEENFWES